MLGLGRLLLARLFRSGARSDAAVPSPPIHPTAATAATAKAAVGVVSRERNLRPSVVIAESSQRRKAPRRLTARDPP